MNCAHMCVKRLGYARAHGQAILAVCIESQPAMVSLNILMVQPG